MTRARWVLVIGLPAMIALAVVLSNTELPLLPEAWRPRAGPFYSAVALAAVAFTLAMVAVVATTPSTSRAAFARHLHVIAVGVGLAACLVWAPLLVALGPRDLLFAVTSSLQITATGLLVIALVRSSRAAAMVACGLGIAGVVIPISSPVLGVVALGVASGCAIVLFAYALPRTLKGADSVR